MERFTNLRTKLEQLKPPGRPITARASKLERQDRSKYSTSYLLVQSHYTLHLC